MAGIVSRGNMHYFHRSVLITLFGYSPEMHLAIAS